MIIYTYYLKKQKQLAYATLWSAGVHVTLGRWEGCRGALVGQGCGLVMGARAGCRRSSLGREVSASYRIASSCLRARAVRASCDVPCRSTRGNGPFERP